MRDRKVALGILVIGLLAATANLSCKGNQEHEGKTLPKEHGGTATAPTKEHGGTIAK